MPETLNLFEMPDDQLVFNGVDADTGDYLFAPMPLSELAGRIRGEGPQRDRQQRELSARHTRELAHRAVAFGRNPEDLESVGWALLTAEGTDREVPAALEPLRNLRRSQAGDLYRELTVEPGESAEEFYRRLGLAPGPADPRTMPYYLLLVGSPEQIPFSLQYQLDVSYAVGRVHFDTPEEYASYAATVVAAEGAAASSALPKRPRIHLFGTRHPGDASTALSAARLIEPLGAELGTDDPATELTADVGEGATKSRLYDLLVGGSAPELLFTATHGLGGSGAVDGRRETQGSLVCQEWPGPLKRQGGVRAEHYLAGADIPGDRPVVPRVVFSFSCYGAGTPAVTDFEGSEPEPAPAGDSPFVARLPQRLLGNPAGGALAFVGHVDRAWSSSFLWGGVKPQIVAMTSALEALHGRWRIGHALEYLNSRAAEISTLLTEKQTRIRNAGLLVDDRELTGLWMAYHDARNYVLLGDPAVRCLRAEDSAEDT
ncbi:hypothetical protein P3T37_001481 [Kitasatospora sp. MAA4]|uniref:hypothetical protein n=1 Tax=Kitasatospora sp. MAA4 TaxID=3035093 RepID=UPI002476C546|nr:hypothetical protein [Kitasatospora sp. MAA4]MDH6132096.1 hypothetical protein [Kitasatospora sp. MAA4]